MLSSSYSLVQDADMHTSGCARSEGYYKINPSDKSRYLPHLRRSKADNKDKSTVSDHAHLIVTWRCVCVCRLLLLQVDVGTG